MRAKVKEEVRAKIAAMKKKKETENAAKAEEMKKKAGDEEECGTYIPAEEFLAMYPDFTKESQVAPDAPMAATSALADPQPERRMAKTKASQMKKHAEQRNQKVEKEAKKEAMQKKAEEEARAEAKKKKAEDEAKVEDKKTAENDTLLEDVDATDSKGTIQRTQEDREKNNGVFHDTKPLLEQIPDLVELPKSEEEKDQLIMRLLQEQKELRQKEKAIKKAAEKVDRRRKKKDQGDAEKDAKTGAEKDAEEAADDGDADLERADEAMKLERDLEDMDTQEKPNGNRRAKKRTAGTADETSQGKKAKVNEEKDTEKNNQDDEEEPCEEDQPKDNGEELKGEEGAEPKEADESGDRRKRKQADEEAQKLIWSN